MISCRKCRRNLPYALPGTALCPECARERALAAVERWRAGRDGGYVRRNPDGTKTRVKKKPKRGPSAAVEAAVCEGRLSEAEAHECWAELAAASHFEPVEQRLNPEPPPEIAVTAQDAYAFYRDLMTRRATMQRHRGTA